MHLSVEESLKNLRTTYIDILYVHWPDYVTSVEEIMNGLHNLVVSGKVLYLVSRYYDVIESRFLIYGFQGVSDTPAWVVSQANTYAKLTGKSPFVIYQGAWNVMDRSFERDIIPMARSLGSLFYLCEDEITADPKYSSYPRPSSCSLERSCIRSSPL